MKKLLAVILTIALALSSTALAHAKSVYDSEKLVFVVVAADESTDETYVTELAYKTTLKRIKSGKVYEVYALKSDSLVKINWAIGEDDSVTLTNAVTNEPIVQ